MNGFIVRFQHAIDLPYLSLLLIGFYIVEEYFSLNEEYTDSIRLLSPKGPRIIW